MESLVRSLEENCKAIFMADAAILRVAIIDTDGMDLIGITKTHFAGHKDALPPMINQFMKYFDQFLSFMRNDPSDPFIFSWYFDSLVIFAAGSPYGTIILYCDKDVNDGLVKKLLKNVIVNYEILMEPVFK
ncbi:MAG TPA: hypothetical protein VKK79_11390 [Candidatus Lokiarchaeia archaeon]|nr:hypothetical protein [Candidatus Lokiarchaeia archaeon]